MDATDARSSSRSVLAARTRSAIASTRAVVDSALPRIGDLSFGIFTTFVVVLFSFTVFTDLILCIVVYRAQQVDQFSFTPVVQGLNIIWMCIQALLFLDLFYIYFRFYRPRPRDSDRPKIANSRVRQPKIWRVCTECMHLDVTPRGYLLLLSLLLPLNALLFYDGLGRPVYTHSRLAAYNISELLGEAWPRGAGLALDPSSWELSVLDNGTLRSFAPPLVITSRACYPPMSAEYLLLGRLRSIGNVSELSPKQAYCEALIGTMMAQSFGDPPSMNDMSWKHDEDKWDEAFEFALRLFSSLAGIVADQSEGVNTMLSMVGFSFLKDMTDVFDMLMLTFVDVEQLHEGRPLLTENHGVKGYEWSYHGLVYAWLWLGMAVVLLRALAVVGFTPFVGLFAWLRCSCSPEELRKPVDAFFSLLFIEVPFLSLRWIAWWHYGVPVSVMAVKNVLGIYEDLLFLGVLQGFGADVKPRGVRLCCRRRSGGETPAEDAEAGKGAGAAGGAG